MTGGISLGVSDARTRFAGVNHKAYVAPLVFPKSQHELMISADGKLYVRVRKGTPDAEDIIKIPYGASLAFVNIHVVTDEGFSVTFRAEKMRFDSYMDNKTEYILILRTTSATVSRISYKYEVEK